MNEGRFTSFFLSKKIDNDVLQAVAGACVSNGPSHGSTWDSQGQQSDVNMDDDIYC